MLYRGLNVFLNTVFVGGSVLIALTAVESVADTSSLTLPKYYVAVVPAQDRWVTLTSGAKVYQGVEVSYLLGQKLLDSNKFIPVMVDPLPTTPIVTAERQSQIPNEWTSWLAADAGSGFYSLKITPVIETMLYASGSRGDRVVFGFSPDNLNPFNAGEDVDGAIDNEYVASATQQQSCQKPDFFNGQFTPPGWGPLNTTFGVNLDQGVSINLFGYGFGFKHITYEVKSQIRFLVDDYRNGTHQELVFQTKAKGSDVFVAGSYSGFSLGFEIQRATTLVQALKQLLPQVVSSVMNEEFSGPWQSSITSVSGTTATMGAGLDQNVNQGLQLASPEGDIYVVTDVTAHTATLQLLSGGVPSVVGDLLRAYTGDVIDWSDLGPVSPVATGIAVSNVATTNGITAHRLVASTETPQGTVKVFSATTQLATDDVVRASTQVAAITGCVDKKIGWLENLADELATLYALFRYESVFDQAATNPKPGQTVAGLRIALIDSGVDVKDKSILSHLNFDAQNTLIGFDFISWDPRPSDDNGHGTAAAKLLIKLAKKPFSLLPAKVVGPKGETHSAAIYDGFTFAVNNHADAIVVPWSSAAGTLDAYTQGVALATAANIPVFVAPNTVSTQNNVYVGTKVTKGYKTQGLDATVVIGPEGTGTIQALANWINSK